MTRPTLTRRTFLEWTAISAALGLSGCAVNPVSGEKQLMLMSEQGEVEIDEKHSPHQFSADYGVSSDAELNAYLDEVGREIAAYSHRPDRPYSFRTVNATYVNAYAFPGGTIAATRGILVRLEDESELAALLGHEIAHVSWRHTASSMSTGTLVSLAISGAAFYAAHREPGAGALAQVLGGIATGALLARYSRSDEREADATGMEYMVRSGYDPRGMIGLMDMMNNLRGEEPGALDLMFATHPMSSERLAVAREKAFTAYPEALGGRRGRERYKDSIAGLRKMEPALLEMEHGRAALAKGKKRAAREHLDAALKIAPDDYCGLIMAAECSLSRRNLSGGLDYVRAAREIDPSEPRSYAVAGMLYLERKDYGSAYDELKTYESRLPGNPNIVFGMGYAAENMREYRKAARHYLDYLDMDRQSDRARYAYERLVEWGVIKA
jgi:predicted Zn-dependent protease